MRRNLLIFSLWIPVTLITLLVSVFILENMSAFYKTKPDVSQVLGVNEYQLYAALPKELESIDSLIKTADARPEILRNFFLKYNSPLEPESQLLVDIADNYNLDFRLLPAIAMQESNLCKKIPEDSYNCWGYGIYGDKVVRFESYAQGAEIVAKSIRNKYVDKGLITPEEIMAKYTPSSNGSWAKAVRLFMERME